MSFLEEKKAQIMANINVEDQAKEELARDADALEASGNAQLEKAAAIRAEIAPVEIAEEVTEEVQG